MQEESMVCFRTSSQQLRALCVMKSEQVRGVGLTHRHHVDPEEAHLEEVFRERARTETQMLLGNTCML